MELAHATFPNLKVQRSNPLTHWGKLESGGTEQEIQILGGIQSSWDQTAKASTFDRCPTHNASHRNKYIKSIVTYPHMLLKVHLEEVVYIFTQINRNGCVNIRLLRDK